MTNSLAVFWSTTIFIVLSSHSTANYAVYNKTPLSPCDCVANKNHISFTKNPKVRLCCSMPMNKNGLWYWIVLFQLYQKIAIKDQLIGNFAVSIFASARYLYDRKPLI